MSMVFWNNAGSTLSATIIAGDTTISIQSADVALFPAVVGPDYMYLTLDDGTNFEVVKVTAHTASAQTFTVVRGQDNTTARSFAATTTKVEIRIPAAALNNLVDLDSADTITGLKTFSTLPVLTTLTGILRADTGVISVDTTAMLLAGAQNVTGVKTFTVAPVFSNGASFTTTTPSSSVGFDFTAGNVKLGTGNTIELADQNALPTPVASKLLLYSRNFGGRRLPKITGPAGIDTFLQEALWENNSVLWKPGAANNFTFLGDTPTVNGTITTPTLANGSYGAEMNRRNIAMAAATANTANGILGTTNQYARIVAAGHGGFFFFCRFRNSGTISPATSYRTFLGLSNQGAIPITDPSAGAFSMVGIGFNAADTTLFITLKDGTTANRIAVTGSNKTSGSTYDCAIFCPPGNATIAGNIYYRVDDVNAQTTLVSDVATGVSTNAPLANAFMRPVAFVGSLTAVIMNIEIAQFYCSSDF